MSESNVQLSDVPTRTSIGPRWEKCHRCGATVQAKYLGEHHQQRCINVHTDTSTGGPGPMPQNPATTDNEDTQRRDRDNTTVCTPETMREYMQIGLQDCIAWGEELKRHAEHPTTVARIEKVLYELRREQEAVKTLGRDDREPFNATED